MPRIRYRVGDTVIAKASSNEEYNITNLRNGCVARVIEVDYGDEDDIKVEITKLKRETNCIGEIYWVNSDHFMLAKDNSATKLLMEGKRVG